MKKENLSDAMNLINDDIIEQTAAARTVNKKHKTMRVVRTCVAACLVMAITATVVVLYPKFKENNKNSPQPSNQNLPTLEISHDFGDMGFEGYWLNDISELVNANPWNEDTTITTLPVFNNVNYPNNTDKKIEFNPSVSLPQKYNFTHYSSYEETLAVAEYLKNEYKNIISFKSPKINITGGNYDIYGNQSYNIEFFDSSDDLIQDIINYNFYCVAFYCDDDGKLFLARIYQPDLSNKIGDYPIISADKAKELLANGNYITSVPYKMPDIEYIKKVELIYRNTYWLDKIYMPYYKFYVELPENQDIANRKGLTTYGAYYVPAVEKEYISNMPTWDGRFN